MILFAHNPTSAISNLDIRAVIWYNTITVNDEFFVVLQDISVMTGLATCRQPPHFGGGIFFA